MIPSDIFIVTPFYRDQIELGNSSCQEEPDIPFTSYSVYVFRSRLESFLRKYFNQPNRLNYDYNEFVLKDIPYEGRMISTLQLIDSNYNFIKLSAQEIRDINLEISQMIVLHPDYLLFLDESILSNYPQAWTRTILSSLEFERFSYSTFDKVEKFDIPSIYENGIVYLNLSDDPTYLSTIKKLYEDTLDKLDEFYHKGTIPNETEYTGNGVTVTVRTPGDFLQFEGKLGDEVMEEVASEIASGFKNVIIPDSDKHFITEKEKLNPNETTVFVINYSDIDMNLEFLETQIGLELLVSLKKFLKADEIITKKVSPGYYEIVAKKDGVFITSDVDLKEMFGFFYFTDNPLGLMVLNDLDLLTLSKAIYDSASGKGAIFVPDERYGDVLQMDELYTLLHNKIKNYDCYTRTDDIELTLMRLGLEIELRVDDYLFVKKNRWIPKRIVYRGLEEKNPKMLLSGNWNFEEMSPETIIEMGQEIMYDLDNDGVIQEGPFNTLVVPVSSLDFIENFYNRLNEKVHQKYKPSRNF